MARTKVSARKCAQEYNNKRKEAAQKTEKIENSKHAGKKKSSMATQEQMQNMKTESKTPITKGVETVTLSQAQIKKEPKCKVQYGEVMEDMSISWGRKSTATLYWEDGCVGAKDCVYGAVCDGIYFEWNPTERFRVAKKNMGAVREANDYCFRVLEVLEEVTKVGVIRGRKRKAKEEPVEEPVEDMDDLDDEDDIEDVEEVEDDTEDHENFDDEEDSDDSDDEDSDDEDDEDSDDSDEED